jgi:hypothetical protein
VVDYCNIFASKARNALQHDAASVRLISGPSMEQPAGEYKGQPLETDQLAAAAAYYYSGQRETIGFWRNALSAYT